MKTFKLEEYLTRYEFDAPYLLCCSDAESYSMAEILSMANKEEQKLWDNLSLGYTETWGHPLLRKQVAQSFYPNQTADNILCFAGAEEAIYAALTTICRPQDHVIVVTPCYQSLYEVPYSIGAKVTSIELREEHAWKIDIEQIKKSINKNTKCVVINFPHNPTGQVIEQEELESLVALCKKYDLWLFSDEVYRLMGNPQTPWAQPAAELYSKAISLGVMSKAFGMPGLRIGWLACKDTAMLAKIKNLKDYLSICNSAPAEVLSLIALRNKNSILEKNNQLVASNLKLLDEFFARKADLFSWIRPQGGCVGFPLLKGKESIDIFSHEALTKAGVLLLPASIYDYPSNHFRIGFGRKNFKEVLTHFEQFIDNKI